MTVPGMLSGSEAATWWPNWSSMLRSVNKLNNPSTKTRFVAGLPSAVYASCKKDAGDVVCVDDDLFRNDGGIFGTFIVDFFGYFNFQVEIICQFFNLAGRIFVPSSCHLSIPCFPASCEHVFDVWYFQWYMPVILI